VSGKRVWPIRLTFDKYPNGTIKRTITPDTTFEYTDPSRKSDAYIVGTLYIFAPLTLNTTKTEVPSGKAKDLTYTLVGNDVPELFFVHPQTGLMSGQFTPKDANSNKTFTFDLVVVDGGGYSAVVEHFELETVLPNPFAVPVDGWKWNQTARASIYPTSFSNLTDPNNIYARGGLYHFPPIQIVQATGDHTGIAFDGITFTIVNAPTGFLIDPKDGYISGTPTEVGRFNLQIHALDRTGAETHLATIKIDVRNGPGDMPCLNQGRVNLLPLDRETHNTSFACDCSATGYEGPNCGTDENVALASASKTRWVRGAIIAGGFFCSMLVVFAANKYRLHVKAMRPVDFTSILSNMIESGECSNELIHTLATKPGKRASTFGKTLGTNVPREIPRRCITQMEVIGDGEFGTVFKGILDETSNNGGVPGYMVACKTQATYIAMVPLIYCKKLQ
jgi:hypothetical protein